MIAASVSVEQFLGEVGYAYRYGMAVANWEWGVIPALTLMIALFVLVMALLGQLQVALIVFGSLASLLLLPASIKVNVESWQLLRRAEQHVSGATRAKKGRSRFATPQLAPEAAVVSDRSGPTELSERR